MLAGPLAYFNLGLAESGKLINRKNTEEKEDASNDHDSKNLAQVKFSGRLPYLATCNVDRIGLLMIGVGGTETVSSPVVQGLSLYWSPPLSSLSLKYAPENKFSQRKTKQSPGRSQINNENPGRSLNGNLTLVFVTAGVRPYMSCEEKDAACGRLGWRATTELCLNLFLGRDPSIFGLARRVRKYTNPFSACMCCVSSAQNLQNPKEKLRHSNELGKNLLIADDPRNTAKTIPVPFEIQGQIDRIKFSKCKWVEKTAGFYRGIFHRNCLGGSWVSHSCAGSDVEPLVLQLLPVEIVHATTDCSTPDHLWVCGSCSTFRHQRAPGRVRIPKLPIRTETHMRILPRVVTAFQFGGYWLQISTISPSQFLAVKAKEFFKSK
ncbi:hypothetical protein EK904_011891, partial [Melospiza melodia maxima]